MNLKRILAAVLALVLVLPCFPTAARAVDATLPIDTANYNIGIVVDGSGSLRPTEKSDPNGYRYDAIKMFFSLLSNQGSNVCAVVFRGNKTLTDTSDAAMRDPELMHCYPEEGLLSITSRDDKESVVDYIEDVTPGGYTDIGTALLIAAERLDGMTQENSLPSIILLFTDGTTEFPEDTVKAVYEKSEANKDAALALIRKNGITLCAVYLTTDPEDDSTEVADLVRDSITDDSEMAAAITEEELKEGKRYFKVTDSASLPGIFQNFYELICPTEKRTLDKTDTFTLPGSGVEELNILITTSGSYDIGKTRLTRLEHEDGTVIDSTRLASIGTFGRTYAAYKLTDLPTGEWTLKWTSPDPSAECHLLVSTSIAARMSLSPPAWEAGYKVPVSVSANLFSQGQILTKSSDYDEYRCYLTVTNTVTDQLVLQKELFLDSDGHFSDTYTPDQFGTFSVQVIYECGQDFRIVSEAQTLKIDNTTPEITSSAPLRISAAFGMGGTQVVDLSKYIHDKEHALHELTIVPDKSSYPFDQACAIAADNSTLTVDGRTGGSGTLRLTVYDPEKQHTDMELTIVYRDRTIPIIITVLALVILIVVLILLAMRRTKQTMTVSGTVTFVIPLKNGGIGITLDAMECMNKDLYTVLTARTRRLISLASEKPALRRNATALVKNFLAFNRDSLSDCRFTAISEGLLRSRCQLELSNHGNTVRLTDNYTENIMLAESGELKLTYTA